MLPAFATLDDLEARLPAGVEVDPTRAQAALDDASSLIHAESAEAWVTDGALVDDVPPVALMVCCKAAIRALVNPAGTESQTTGPYTSRFGDVYLTAKESNLIKQAAGGTAGLWTLATTRDDTYGGDLLEIDGTLYLDVTGQSEPMPFIPSDT